MAHGQVNEILRDIAGFLSDPVGIFSGVSAQRRQIRRNAAQRLKKAILSGKVTVAAVASRVGRSERTVIAWVEGALPPMTAVSALEDIL